MTSLARLGPAVRATVPPFHVMDVWAAAGERARTHGDLVNLSAGQPSTPAPVDVRAAAQTSITWNGGTVARTAGPRRARLVTAPP